ncbi:tRNA dihydrouridine synthase DusB [Bacteroidales bacterium OttesenSCG-928-C19]|nr:tRNA dihydrouridine synthase DusB [Bacteroidales bacterium OttesenSCG-928-C19]
MVKIGNVEVGEFPLILSPMEEITDTPFRELCKPFGVDVLFTEFIASDALVREVEKSKKKMCFSEMQRPIGIQIFGNDEDAMVGAAKVAELENPDFIDINWGCPVRKVAGKGSGSGILNNIPKMIQITKSVVEAVNIPVTVKTRLGYDDANKPIVEIAEQLQDIGIKAISIHGRTRAQMYKGEADWTLIGEVKNNPRMAIPVFGNGDVTSPEIALEMKNRYGVDGILIGRGAIGNPWIFKQTKALLAKKTYEEPSISERVEVCKNHLLASIQAKEERGAILEIRKHYSGYFKGIENFKPFRIRLISETTLDELLQTFSEIEEYYANF